MKVKTGELIGKALDFAVVCATARKVNECMFEDETHVSIARKLFCGDFSPSTNWDQCGKLIDYYKIELRPLTTDIDAYICKGDRRGFGDGDTYMIAACRAIVHYEIGPELDIPEELLK